MLCSRLKEICYAGAVHKGYCDFDVRVLATMLSLLIPARKGVGRDDPRVSLPTAQFCDSMTSHPHCRKKGALGDESFIVRRFKGLKLIMSCAHKAPGLLTHIGTHPAFIRHWTQTNLEVLGMLRISKVPEFPSA